MRDSDNEFWKAWYWASRKDWWEDFRIFVTQEWVNISDDNAFPVTDSTIFPIYFIHEERFLLVLKRYLKDTEWESWVKYGDSKDIGEYRQHTKL